MLNGILNPLMIKDVSYYTSVCDRNLRILSPGGLTHSFVNTEFPGPEPVSVRNINSQNFTLCTSSRNNFYSN